MVLRPISAGDQEEFLALARASVGLHHPWYSMPMTPEEFRSYLARYDRPGTEGFLVCLRDGGGIAGVVTIDSIIFQGGNVNVEYLLDTVGHNQFGSMNVMQGLPEPGFVLALIPLAFMSLRRLRRDVPASGIRGRSRGARDVSRS